MEYRNFYNTPRDSVSDEMLTELLAENEPEWGGNDARVVYDRRQTDYRPLRGGNVRMEVPNGGVQQTPNCRGEYPAVPAADTMKPWENPKLGGAPLAMVYSPVQEWEDIYEVENALRQGTIFKKLVLDFYPGCCGK